MNKIMLTTVFFLSLLTLGCTNNNSGQFVIENASSEQISVVEVEVCGQHFESKNLMIGEKISFAYKVKSDSDYKIDILFVSGKKITKNIGYVTHGIDFKDSFSVIYDDIVMSRSRIEGS